MQLPIRREALIILLKMKTAIEVVVHTFIISRRNLESTLRSYLFLEFLHKFRKCATP